MLDIHSHILPGVDDGASSWEEAIAMARCAAEDGIHAIVCTPHMDAESNDINDIDVHAELLNRLQQRLVEERIDITLLPGAEWMLSPDLINIVQEKGRLGGSRAFLFELSRYMPVSAGESLVVEAVHKGLRPVIAHPERHPWVDEKNIGILEQLCSPGGLLQITAGSLTGEFGKAIQRIAESIVRKFPEYVIIASDAHRITVRKPQIKAGYSALERIRSGLAEEVRIRTNNLLIPD